MSDVIKLLPDAVANQIAAGEVVQRPASAVKELLENSVDAGSTDIKLIIKEAGRALIQVIDNGRGMSVTDARLCFERHATSKISRADDLFAIKTMGFRGEAMASIAAVSQVEMKTRPAGEALGTKIVIEGSMVKTQEPCQSAEGTQISIKNLFFNIPARRNFLKSNQVELRHIVDEFTRVAMAFPNVAFTLINNDQELYRLDPAGLRQRITALFGSAHNERLVPLASAAGNIKMEGYIGKPEYAKKTRGDQFFFVNNRFIRSPYLHHAVTEAFDDLLPSDAYPSYYIFLEVDPSAIDINIHPTKTEIKFEDEKTMYALLRAAVKQSLGKYHISPSLDFERESAFDVIISGSGELRSPSVRVNPNYNPFEPMKPSPNWEKLYPEPSRDSSHSHSNLGNNSSAGIPDFDEQEGEVSSPVYLNVSPGYILTFIRSGMVIIDQAFAHERILYERFLQAIEANIPASQQQLFPQTIRLNTQDLRLLEELMPSLHRAGFELDLFGNDSIVINGIPAGCEEQNLEEMLEKILENYRREKEKPATHIPELLARTLASRLAIKRGKKLLPDEMKHLADELFACQAPYVSPHGKPTLITITADELENRFQRS